MTTDRMETFFFFFLLYFQDVSPQKIFKLELHLMFARGHLLRNRRTICGLTDLAADDRRNLRRFWRRDRGPSAAAHWLEHERRGLVAAAKIARPPDRAKCHAPCLGIGDAQLAHRHLLELVNVLVLYVLARCLFWCCLFYT